MISSPFVSICIPTYNQIHFLKKTLDSITIQTFKNYEVIVTDDSTTNEVCELVKKYESLFNLTYVRNPVSLGSPANWNKALSFCKGDLVKFIHHDDWFSGKDSLLEFVKVFEDPNIKFAFCNSEIRNISQNSISYNIPPKEFIEQLRNNPNILFNNNRIGAPTAMMYRKNSEKFDERMKYLVDLDFYIRLLKKDNFCHIDKALIVNTSHHEGQVTASSMDKQTQVGEYSYLYNKVYKGKIPSIALSWFFIKLFRTHRIKSVDEIFSFINELIKPTWYFKILIRIANINRN